MDQLPSLCFTGVYKISGLDSGWVNLKATATIDGEEWVGMRAVQAYNDGPAQSMNIVMGPVSKLGKFTGVVTDMNTHPLSNARVIASARYPEGVSGPDSSFVSMVAFTNDSGRFYLKNVPSSIKVDNVEKTIHYTLLASYAGEEGSPIGFDNADQTATTASGELVFNLRSSSSLSVDTPANWYLGISSWTMPSDIISRGPRVYDAIRADVSPTLRNDLRSKKSVQQEHPKGIAH